ncbi:hypothetical protein PT974_00433 [Cladobotryum mycophilum]|uniref:Uncharacterized protein n=1 Tax=Cladobotryum mycophilum TaxID=491253 RepID=A0ABR0T136_9HYPO
MATTTTATTTDGIIGRARRASLSVINVNPQLGMWQAAGTAIAQAPNLTELRDVELGGENITFNAQGHSARLAAVHEDTGQLSLVKSNTNRTNPFEGSQPAGDRKRSAIIDEVPAESAPPSADQQQHDDDEKHPHRHHHHHHHGLFHRRHKEHKKADWGPTIKHGLQAFWKFFLTPSGFLITIYFLNIVAWGKWLEVDSQILNALFCVTAFGLAPWRFRDLYFFIRAAHFKNAAAMRRLAEQNKSWFRPPAWATQDEEMATTTMSATKSTFTGQLAPPTPLWKLGFTIWMMVWNTLLQAVLCFFMWHYNRIDRPSWATGTFIGLGCGVSMFAGLMSWWEGRKVKKIEGPEVKIVE